MIEPSDEGHVLMPRFGLEQLSRDENRNPVLSSLLPDIGVQGLDSVSAKIVQIDRYETTFNIFDHERFSESKLYALVAMHPKEDATSYSKLYRSIYRYHHHQIYQKTGLSLDRFFELPHDIVELLFKISTETAKQDNGPIDKMLEELKKQG
jgi:hypothetical protein